MNPDFEVIVLFNGQKYDIGIDEDKQTISFRDIYPKLQQVIKISANEDIDLLTHDFEIFCPGDKTPYTLTNLNVQVKNLTLISIKSATLLGEIPVLHNYRQEVEDFHSIMMAINIGWDFCGDLSMANWERVTNILNRTDSRHRPGLCKYLFFKWINFYAQNYIKFEGKISPSSQQIFDLLKMVHVLDLDKFHISPDTRQQVEAIFQSAITTKYPYWEHLANIREKKVLDKDNQMQIIVNKRRGPVEQHRNCFSSKPSPKASPKAGPKPNEPNIRRSDSRSRRSPPTHKKSTYKVASTSASKKQAQPNAKPEDSTKNKLIHVPTISKLRHEVEDFHAVVMAINIGCDFSGYQSQDNWEMVSDIIRKSKTEYRSRHCRELFYKWLNYYVQKYDIFEGNIAPELQKTFDLLKVVHVLDLDKFNINSDTRQKINDISQSVLANPKDCQRLVDLRQIKVQEHEAHIIAKKGRPDKQHNNTPNSKPYQKTNPRVDPNRRARHIRQFNSRGGSFRHNENNSYRGNGTPFQRGSTYIVDPRNYDNRQRSHSSDSWS